MPQAGASVPGNTLDSTSRITYLSTSRNAGRQGISLGGCHSSPALPYVRVLCPAGPDAASAMVARARADALALLLNGAAWISGAQ